MPYRDTIDPPARRPSLQAIPDGGAARPLAGTWRAQSEGRSLLIVLARTGHALAGRLDGGPDYCLGFEGLGGDSTATGTAQGPLGELRFEAAVRGSGLLLALTARDPKTGKDRRMQFQFTRVSDDTTFEPCPPQVEYRDPRVLGTWRNASMAPVGSTMVTDERTLHFTQDGAFARNDNGRRSFGRWRTVGELIYRTTQGAVDWHVLATIRPAGSGVRIALPDGRSFSRMANANA